MFKQLIFIALIALAASKHTKSHRPEDPEQCAEQHCEKEIEKCFASEHCLEDLFACDDGSENETGELDEAELDCIDKVKEAQPMIQCIIENCSESQKRFKMSHKQSKYLKRLSVGLKK